MKLLALKKKKKGFTLLKLLVVLAVLTIFIAIAVPVYKDQKEKAAITAHSANIRVLETAVEGYRQNNDGKLPGNLQELVKGEYIKNVPRIPTSNNENLKGVKTYSIDEEKGIIIPIEIDRDKKGSDISQSNTNRD